MWKEISHIFPSNDGTGFSPDRIPTIEDLHGAITKAQTAWHEKRLKGMGKAKDRFFSFLETMNDHSYLFSVVPQGDRYLSLITGVVTTVVNVRTAISLCFLFLVSIADDHNARCRHQ